MSATADTLQARAEVLKLARILGRDPETVAYLERLSLDDLRLLRDQVTEVLWSANGQVLSRLALASRLLPAGVSATISQRAFGPLLTARMAALLEPARAVEVATNFSPSFMADVAIELDPRRAREVIAQIPPDHIAAVTGELVAREEYVTMGRFVGHLSDEALAAALAQMDNRALLQVAFVLEEPERFDVLIGMLSAERLGGLVTAAADGDLWPQALDLLAHLSASRREEIAAATVATLSPRRLRAIAQRAREAGVIDQLGPLEDALTNA